MLLQSPEKLQGDLCYVDVVTAVNAGEKEWR